MKERLLYLLKIYLLIVLTFINAKVLFMLYNGTDQSVSFSDHMQAIYHGLSLDLSTALYFLILPFLAILVSIWTRVPRILFYIYYGFIAVVFALTFVFDTVLYNFWNFKLDSSCLQYLATPKEAVASVSVGFLLAGFVIMLLIALFIYLALTVPRLSFLNRINDEETTTTQRILTTVIMLAIIPVFIIGIRGGLSESTTNIGQVYYSDNQFLNHSAVNPVFSFFSSLEDTASDVPDYNFMDESERSRVMDGLYPTTSVDADSLLRTTRPNIVIILMESCGGIFTEDIGHRKEVMPYFNKLVKEGVYFSNMYANSFRTDRGTLCTWSGFLSFPRFSIMKMPSMSRHLPSIAKTLKAKGYATSYIYGGDINFTNMRSYLFSAGFEQITWMKDYTIEEQNSAKWGVRDDITFNTLAARIKNNTNHAPSHLAPRTSYLIGFSTLSSHEPWDVPTHRLSDPILNSFNYLDECIGRFIEDMKKSPEWDNLLVILLPDHGYSHCGVNFEHEDHDHVPMLWLGGAIKEPRRIEKICNQSDLAATLLGQMKLPHDEFYFSRDVMSTSYTYPFAVHNYNNGMSMVDSTGFMVYDLNSNSLIVNKSSDAKRMVRIGKAILQTESKKLRSLPPTPPK